MFLATLIFLSPKLATNLLPQAGCARSYQRQNISHTQLPNKHYHLTVTAISKSDWAPYQEALLGQYQLLIHKYH